MRKRNKSVCIRYSDEEYEQLQEKVKQSGQTLQSYVINSSLGATISPKEEIELLKEKNKLLADIDKQLRGMGTNLNQMAHVANGQGIVPTAMELVRTSAEVSQIKSEVDEIWRSTRQSISRQNHTEP